jgi:hypothetical protein
MEHQFLIRLSWLALVPGCLAAPSYDGTVYRCQNEPICPDGFTCMNSVCVARNTNGDGSATPSTQMCFGSFDLDKICFSVIPTMPVTIDDMKINTDDLTMCDPNNDQKGKYCVIAGAGLTLHEGKTIRAFGSRPLMLLSTTVIDLQGVVDVSSNHNAGPTNIGAGANPPGSCTGTLSANGNSGGFGGSFGGQGGDGQAKDGRAALAATALVGFPNALRGGCPGGAGSAIADIAIAGTGGSGGGAVAIIATVKIDFNNRINASGAGGRGGSAQRSGGGGGGSGGMIVLDAPLITPGAKALVFANGGGGAEGGAGPLGGTASAGAPGGESTGPAIPAPKGGTTATDGGDGGDGSSIVALGGAKASGQSQNDGGGGGGGGGAGFVHAPGIAAAMVAPPSTDPR